MGNIITMPFAALLRWLYELDEADPVQARMPFYVDIQ